MKSHLRRLIAPMLLVATLIFPLAMTEAQRGNRKQRRANQQNQNANSTQSNSGQANSTPQTQNTGQGRRGRRGGTTAKGSGEKHEQTVGRQVNQATLTSAQINTIRNTEGVKNAVTINGMTITPRSGASLLAFPNGGYTLVTNSDQPTQTGYASQAVLTPKLGGGFHFALCLCALSGGNDSCKFNGGVDSAHCGGQHCCGFHEGDIAVDGTITMSH